jgi:hypothetical protein
LIVRSNYIAHFVDLGLGSKICLSSTRTWIDKDTLDHNDCRVWSPVITVDVNKFEDRFLDFKWAFKKLPKSIPEALKKDLGPWLD